MSQRAQHKATSRAAIVRASTALLRARGVRGMSVERAMAGAGLTVGAFYAHFASKHELLEAAFASALDDIFALLRRAGAGQQGRAALADVVMYYLSSEHRDQPRRGCPMPALAGDAAAHGGRALQRLMGEGVEALATELSRVADGAVTADGALALVVTMVGGQVLARATGKGALSDRILMVSRVAAKRYIDREGGRT